MKFNQEKWNSPRHQDRLGGHQMNGVPGCVMSVVSKPRDVKEAPVRS